MKNSRYFLNVLHIIVVGALCLAARIIKTLEPSAVLPHVSIPLLSMTTLIPLVLEYYISPEINRNWFFNILLAAITFALLPWSAGLTINVSIWELALVGAAAFAVTAALYTSIGRRMKTGGGTKAAPIVNALCMFLAAQGFQGLM